MTLKHGEIKFLSEVVSDSSHDDSVRVIGRLRQIDVSERFGIIEHDGATLRVDTNLLGEVEWRIGSLYSFIGEVSCQAEQKALQARVCRPMDGLDTQLYAQAGLGGTTTSISSRASPPRLVMKKFMPNRSSPGTRGGQCSSAGTRGGQCSSPGTRGLSTFLGRMSTGDECTGLTQGFLHGGNCAWICGVWVESDAPPSTSRFFSNM